jgi:DNA-binding transcriptional ArsR family regulator
VGALAEGLPVSRPAVSQHLYVLKDAGLIDSRQEGTKNIYQVNPKGVAAMRNWLDRFWDTALLQFKLAAEKEAAKNKK